ncbi:unnamed protein product [Phytomonas sp. Hart1]|nr:unnamed protein product [Phytomonas sp. Hart1]|eukprot:CCW66815.1 unnamed protein product [Phytomonas sp. isolate Hart1]
MSNRTSDLSQRLERRKHISNISVVLLDKIFPTERCCSLWPKKDPSFLEEEAVLDTLLEKRGAHIFNVEDDKMKEYFCGETTAYDLSVVTPSGETPSQECIRNRNSGQLFVSSDYPSSITDLKKRSELLLLAEAEGVYNSANDRTNFQSQHKIDNDHQIGPTSRWIRQILCVCDDLEKRLLKATLKNEDVDSDKILSVNKKIDDAMDDTLQVPPTVASLTSITVEANPIGVALRFPRLLSRVLTPTETTNDSPRGVWEVPVVLRVLVRANIVHAVCYKPRSTNVVPVSLDGNENEEQRKREVYVSYRDTVAKHETHFLSALHKLIAVLLRAYREERHGCLSSDPPSRGTMPQTRSLKVPVYHVRIAVADKGETRLFQLRPLCDTLITHCIDPSASLMWESTCVLMVLHNLSVITQALLTVMEVLEAAERNREKNVDYAGKDTMLGISNATRVASEMSIVQLLVALDVFTIHCTEHPQKKPRSGVFSDTVLNDQLTREGNISKVRIKKLSQALWTFYNDTCVLLFSHPTTPPLIHWTHDQALQSRITTFLTSYSPALPGPFMDLYNEYLQQSRSNEFRYPLIPIDICEPLGSTESTLLRLFLETNRSFIDHTVTPLRHLMIPPSILVHCRQGVSRSPSVASMYFISSMKHALRNWKHNDEKANPDLALGQGSDGEEGNQSSMTFARFMNILREARPIINPNISFCVQLESFYRRMLKS